MTGPGWFITIDAGGTLIDPEFTKTFIVGGDEPNVVPSETRLDLFGGEVVLYLAGQRFVLFLSKTHERSYYPLAYFLMYRSRVDYNIITSEWFDELPTIVPSNEVTFALERMVRVETEEHRDGRLVRVGHYEAVPATISIGVGELEDLMRLCTRELFLALAYFLVGSRDRRYFLVEFYKALECIESAFGGEAPAVSALTPYGVQGSRFKGLKRLANDRQHPLDIGRHAPQGRADIRTIDVRRLFEMPKSREVVTEAVAATRQAIDAYFAFLRAQKSPEW